MSQFHADMSSSASIPPSPQTRRLAHPLLRGSHLMLTAALGLALCQVPMLLWLLPGSGLHDELRASFPTLADWIERLDDAAWLPISTALISMLVCLHWTRRRILLPLLQIRSQILGFTEQRYVNGEPVCASREIEDLAEICDNLSLTLAEKAHEHQKLAYEDTLTGLCNRLRFNMVTDQTLQASLKRVIVVVWSLDRFSSLNNILGFAAGDQLIKALGARMRQQLDDAVALARLSGHTFAAAFELDEEECPEACISRILDILQEPVRVFGQPIELSAACGAAISPRDGQAATDLTRRAEIAETIAGQSRLRWLMFQSHFEVQSSARLNMLSELRAALQTTGQLQLYLQPKLNLTSGRIEGAEALVRWQHPQRGLVFPNEFIPFAEQTGRIHELTLWAIREAIQLLVQMDSETLGCLSVNISAMDLHEESLPDTVATLLAGSRVQAPRLCLEITESWAMDRPDQVLETLEKLNRLGVRLAIDDFGSGYSSMAYMKRFPVDELKIDRSLVAGIKRNSDSETILRCITDLGHHMGMQVTAEGVETLEEYAAVKALSVDCIQGYLIGKAMPLPQFRQFIERFDSREFMKQ